MKNSIYFTIFFFLFFYSCQFPTKSSNTIYPMQIGNSWNYIRGVEYINVSNDTIPSFVLPRFDPNINVSVNRNETIRDSLFTFVVKTSEGNSQSFSENYYVNNKTGLFGVAYSSAGSAVAFPKQTSKTNLVFKGKRFANLPDLIQDLSIDQIPSLNKVTNDSITFEQEPVQTLKYPLSVGSEWTYRTKNPWPMSKRIEKRETISVRAGTFDCFRIRWLYDWHEDGEWDDDIFIIDHVSNEGLIKREINILGIVLTDDRGNETGTFDFVETMELTNYQLN